MPANTFSIGRDLSVNIVTANGPFRPTLITGFGSKPNNKRTSIKGLDGITRFVRHPDGWEGSIDIERQDSTVDDYFAQVEANYYAGINEASVTITETKQEPNGAITQYRYLGVMLEYADAGQWRGDDTVKIKVNFVAARRVKIQ